MDVIKRLNNISAILLTEEIDYLQLTDCIKDYRDLLESLTQIDLKEAKNRANINVDGVAIGTTWAALCLDDMMRTKLFIKGIAKAIIDLRRQKKGVLQIVYAGTGPYATLILPLLPLYTPKDIQLTLLEINENSYQLVKNTFKQLGFNKYIRNIECTNAITYKMPADLQPDLIISETMLKALDNEHQVPIMLNLLAQVPEKVCIIPEKIELHLAATKMKADCSRIKQSLTTLFEVSQCSLRQILQNKVNQADNLFPTMESTIDLTKVKDYHDLSILTSIQVYGDEWVRFNQSGLTTPKRLTNMEAFEQHNAIRVNSQYQLKPVPKLACNLVGV